jgi:GNAT superfamily N-acetyltransferase
VALTCWLLGMRGVDTSSLGEWGLLTALGPLWFVAAAVVIALLVVELSTRRSSEIGTASAVALFTVLLYATPAVLEAVPRFGWVYKHVAVVLSFQGDGAGSATLDVYQRWPAFFTAAALLDRVARVGDPLTYAAWAELAFALLDGVLVLAIARRFSPDRRWAWLAVVLFTATNWVNQNYFAPQSFAFSLALAEFLLVLTLLHREPGRTGRWLERSASRLLGGRGVVAAAGPATHADVDVAVVPPRARHAAAALVLLLHVAITASHQLTPYLLVLALVPLFVVGYAGPRWLGPVLVVITVAYLVPNAEYVQQKFGLFSLDPLANATNTTVDRAALPIASLLQGRAALLLTVIAYGLGGLGLVRRVRAGSPRSALVVGWFAFSPALMLAGQTYGGEGRYRVVLFSAAWLALAGAWAFRPTDRPRRRAAQRGIGRLAGATLVVLTSLSLAVALQPEGSFHVAAGDVRVLRWIEATAGPRDVVFDTGTGVPLSQNGIDARIGKVLSLTGIEAWYPGGVDVADLWDAAGVSDASAKVYVTFSASTPARFAGLEQELRTAGFTRVLDVGGTRVWAS